MALWAQKGHRMLPEYKNISKRIVVTGNRSYIHLAADTHPMSIFESLNRH